MFLTSLLVIGLYFKFNRFWSMRNLDLILLILLGPGMVLALEGGGLRLAEVSRIEASASVLLLDTTSTESSEPDSTAGAAVRNENQPPIASVAFQSEQDTGQDSEDSEDTAGELAPSARKVIFDPGGDQEGKLFENEFRKLIRLAREKPTECELLDINSEFRNAVLLERIGYIWLFTIGLLFAVRLLIDSGLQRRPFLEPNLNSSGLAFIAVALLGFLLVDIVQTPVLSEEAGADELMRMVNRETDQDAEKFNQYGPGYYLLHSIPSIPMFVSRDGISVPDNYRTNVYSQQMKFIAKLMAVLCQVGIVAGIFLIAHWHFGNSNLAIAVTALYLVLPYTGQLGGRVFHVLPALLLVWAIVCYRRPMIAGTLIGLAAGVFYYPMFLIPLWFSFYWDRGRLSFLAGFAISLSMVIGSLVFVSDDFQSFATQLRQIFGFWFPQFVGVQGIWALGFNPIYRIPLLVAFVGLAVSFIFWPIPKNLGSLISCTAATMVVVQFCHGFGGGLYIAWYLPLLVLTVFRPNLQERIALRDVIIRSRTRPAQAASA